MRLYEIPPSAFERQWDFRSHGARRCQATKRNGQPCEQRLTSTRLSVAVCGRHAGSIEQAWRADVEAAAQVLFRYWTRKATARSHAIGTTVVKHPKRLDRPGVYFLRARHPKYGVLVKIGVSSNVGRRLSNLGYHGFIRFQLLGVEFLPAREAEVREKQLHKIFAPARVRGEWFAPTEELLAFVAQFSDVSDSDEVAS